MPKTNKLKDEHLVLLGRIDGKVDLLLKSHDLFEKRLNGVEKKVYWFSGAAAFAAAILTTKVKSVLGV